MKAFYVLTFDFNKQDVEHYNIIPYLVRCYNEAKKKPVSFEEFKKFIKEESMYQWWSRCQYELVVTGFPQTKQKKIDVHDQVLMNLDIITQILMDEILK